MKITQSKIDEIASSIDIVEIISQYTQLKRSGKNFMGRCPFHQEKTPSFSVSQEKGVYHCFGCGKSGNVFNFIMDIDNVSFYEALRMLAEKANIRIEFDEEEYTDRNKIEILYEINRQAAKYYYDALMEFDGIYAKEYLNHRGIRDETIKRFGLGFSPKQKDALTKELAKTYQKQDLIDAGLTIDVNLHEIRDRFRGRAMFPIFSESGRVVGFGARKIFPDDSLEGKYINSPETKIYNKSKILYGLNFSKKAIKEQGFAILVEGYMDLISLFQSGFENVIASSGTSLTTLQIKILSRYTQEIVIVYDADIAGQNAARRGIELILENNMNVSLIVLPQGEDPDSYILNNGKDNFTKLLNSRKSVINYIGEQYETAGKLATPDGKANFVREIILLIAKINDDIKRDFYIKDIAHRFSIYESLIRKELERVLKLKNRGLTREIIAPRVEEQGYRKIEVNISHPELMLIRLLVDSNKETKDYLLENLEIGYLTDPRAIKLLNYLISNIDKPLLTKPSNLFNVFNDEESRIIISKALLDEYYVMEDSKKKDFLSEAKTIIYQFKKINLEKRESEIKEQMKNDEGNSDKITKLQKTLQNITKERVELIKDFKKRT